MTDHHPGKPSRRIRQKRERVRREIIDTAAGLLREGGPESVTLEAVAGSLGMTRQALYHYYPSKEALMRALVADLLDAEVRLLTDVVGRAESAPAAVAALIRGFYAHYASDLGAFRAVYCQTQMYSDARNVMDADTLRERINPRTRELFDTLEARLAAESAAPERRGALRRYAYTAWTSALGLLTMLSIADATGDPLIHRESDLLDTLVSVFEAQGAALA